MFKYKKIKDELKAEKTTTRKLRTTLLDLRDENENLYKEIFGLRKLVLEIEETIERNDYDNNEAKQRKIKELVTNWKIKTNS